MKTALNSFLLIVLLFFCNVLYTNAQYGYSPVIDSLVSQVTDSSLSILNRQLSGDTSVVISGVTDVILTRHSNYADNSKAAQFILEKFQSCGLSAYLQQYDDNGQNVVATLPGTVYPEQQYIICAHYDDMPSSSVAPGADDNASGVSALLEAARLMSQMSFPYTVKFIAFDEEEQGLIGSQYYADSAYLLGHEILGVFNQDMIAWDGNNDYGYSVCTNTASMPLMESHIDNMRIYQPILSPNVITIGSSDHFRFWGKGYPAVCTIEQYQIDFNPYYHTVNDNYGNMNRPYFLAMSRGVIASAMNAASDFRMELTHQPVETSLLTAERVARLIITSPYCPDTGANAPRMYFRLDNEPFSYVNPVSANGDTLDFIFPEFPIGSKISYYFAAQALSGGYVVTLPEYGRGTNPPGTEVPPLYFNYYILQDTSASYCASGLPLSIPANSTVNKQINISCGGRILDCNVRVSLSHTSCRDINLFLVSPSGMEIELSTKNGFVLDHYSNTVFDDESDLIITQSLPPFTGFFRPEEPLYVLQDTSITGNWNLKMVNTGTTPGTLTDFCILFSYSSGCQYVDGSLPTSGDGQTWETALNSIAEAVSLNPDPGSIIFIKPGVYPEKLTIESNGEQVVPLTTGVILLDTNKIQFPAGTDLSGIDTESFPGKYFAYIYNSKRYNNGYFQVKEIDDEEDFITVDGAIFNDESGVCGDSSLLSVTVALPVIYRKYTTDPENERVILDSVDIIDPDPTIYIGQPVGDGRYNANPANFNIIDGIDFTGHDGGIGLQIQNSSFNVICNNRIHSCDSTGIYVNGNEDNPACHNIITHVVLDDLSAEGISVGTDLMPGFNNQSHFTHILKCEIRGGDSLSYGNMKHAIHISEYNKYNIIENNFIHDIQILDPDQGAVEVHSHANGTRISGNFLKNIGYPDVGYAVYMKIHGQSDSMELSNNVFFSSFENPDNAYALWIDGTGHSGSRFQNNTVFNVNKGLLLEDHENAGGFGILNNIFKVVDDYFVHLGFSGNFLLAHNLYFTNPETWGGSPYPDEDGRVIGHVPFRDTTSGDFGLIISSELAICNGIQTNPAVSFDFEGKQRSPFMPDIGAYELPSKAVWLGLSSHEWDNQQNWIGNKTPEPCSNVVILPSGLSPFILSTVELKGVILKPGSSLIISEGDLNIQN